MAKVTALPNMQDRGLRLEAAVIQRFGIPREQALGIVRRLHDEGESFKALLEALGEHVPQNGTIAAAFVLSRLQAELRAAGVSVDPIAMLNERR